MQKRRIPKKKAGEYRLIYSPNEEEKASLRALLPRLQVIAARICGKCMHGFMPCRSPVTNAMAHRGYGFTLSFDLADFFDSVCATHLRGLIDDDILERVLIDGAPRQGLPTSPTVANIAAAGLDNTILAYIDGKNVVYTRYADDLTFSFNDYNLYTDLKTRIPQLVETAGFALNFNKTRLQDARFGKRVVTGVCVSADIACPRYIRRKMRAAKHYNQQKQLRGLTEWTKLKLPYRPIEHTLMVLRGIFLVKRNKMALQNYTAKDQWAHEFEALAKVGDRTAIASYMRDAFKAGRITREQVKEIDSIVEQIRRAN